MYSDDHPQFGAGSVLLQAEEAGERRWLGFVSPLRVIRAERIEEVRAALGEVETAVGKGLYAAGFLTYEAAPAFDRAFAAKAPRGLPLLWFGIYEEVAEFGSLPASTDGSFATSEWVPSVSYDEYRQAIGRIKNYIASGDTYQVNYTMRLGAKFQGSAWALFEWLWRAQRGKYSAYVDAGDQVICSASPELFFRLCGSEITCRPMKGTAARGLTWEEDEEQARWLEGSAKNRAENLMIVDMVRNDLGRIARVGSVKVERLFQVERYDTLFQMTSTVTASTDAPIGEVVAALFPCASITGAPKVRTTQIIAELETAARGIYTGAIGFIAPGRKAQFNVAIRTAHIDREAGRAEYGTGGGIVWDSVAEEEYEECRTKALVLLAARPSFRLLETLLWKPAGGYFLLERHLKRLADSGRYFAFAMDVGQVVKRLEDFAERLAPQPQRVRLLVSERGEISLEAEPIQRRSAGRRWKVALAKRPVQAGDRFLYHKTTHREVYESARAEFPNHDDVILWNEKGEITESTVANVVVRPGSPQVVRLKRELITPPVSCGLLAGTYRAHLLEKGRIREGIVTKEALAEAEGIYLINSVRGWIPAVLDLQAVWDLTARPSASSRSRRGG